MNTLVSDIKEWMNRNNGLVHSDEGVEISYETVGAVRLVSPLPDYRPADECITLELVIGYSSVKDFIHDFAITHPGDLEDIRPEALWKRYQNEEAELFCSTDEWLNEYLYFRKEKGRLYATNEWNVRHAVPLNPTDWGDLVNYTRNYFLGRAN